MATEQWPYLEIQLWLVRGWYIVACGRIGGHGIDQGVAVSVSASPCVCVSAIWAATVSLIREVNFPLGGLPSDKNCHRQEG